MVFNSFLKLVKADSEEERLKWSVYYGWGLVSISLTTMLLTLIFLEFNLKNESLLITLSWIFYITFFLFVFRYTSVKPFLGAAAGGITVVSIAMIIESLFSRRNNGLSFGALLGVIFVLSFIIIKNFIISFYYLIKETYRYYKYCKNSKEVNLEDTILS